VLHGVSNYNNHSVIINHYYYTSTGYWRKVHSKELNDLYCSSSIIQVIRSGRKRWARHVANMVEKKGAYRVSLGNPDGKKPFGRNLTRNWLG
jgi:hypothetical protein